MSKKISFVVGIILCLTFISCSQKGNRKTCAMVSDTSFSSDISDEISEEVFSKIEEHVGLRNDLKIIDRTKFESVEQELAFQQTNWSDKEKTAEIGKALNADLICFVTVRNNNYVVEFLNVNTFQKLPYTGKYTVSLIRKNVKVKGLKKLEKINLSKLWEE